METNFVKQAKDMQEELVEWRRWIHRHPGIGFDVQETAEYIAQKLRSWGLEVEAEVGHTGVVGIIRGEITGPTVAVRVDMDALPIQEENTHDFISKYPGKMHACGHDAHSAIGLGVAKLLYQQKHNLAGTAIILFQPAEEGQGGAQAMINAGVLQRHGVCAIVGGHVGLLARELSLGQVGICYGPAMAAAYHFEAEIIGRGGHGAQPHETVDPVVISSEVVNAWQRIISRELSPVYPGVLTVGKIQGGWAHNIIPNMVSLSGTIRFFHPPVGEMMLKRTEEILAAICKSWHAQYTFEICAGGPPVINDTEFTDLFARVARRQVGEENVKILKYPTMSSEDMAFYFQKVPGTYYFLGASNPDKGITYPHHHPRFDIDEGVLWQGVALLAETVWEYNHQK